MTVRQAQFVDGVATTSISWSAATTSPDFNAIHRAIRVAFDGEAK